MKKKKYSQFMTPLTQHTVCVQTAKIQHVHQKPLKLRSDSSNEKRIGIRFVSPEL